MNRISLISSLAAICLASSGCEEVVGGAGGGSAAGAVSVALTTVPASARCIEIRVLAGSEVVGRKRTAFEVGSTARIDVVLSDQATDVDGLATDTDCPEDPQQELVDPRWTAPAVPLDPPRPGIVQHLVLAFYEASRADVSARFSFAPIGMSSFNGMQILGADGSIRQSAGSAFTGLAGITDFIQLEGGGYYNACAARANGQVVCFGYNGTGQLGNGTTGGWTSAAVTVSPEPGRTFTSVRSRSGTTCALGLYSGTNTPAPMSCWGNNAAGQIVSGGATNILTPTARGVALDVAIGSQNVCTLLAYGSVICQGANQAGTLGNGTTGAGLGGWATANVPGGIVALEAATNTYFAVRADGTVYAWGDGFAGLFGDGSYGGTRPTPAPIPGLPPVDDLQVGASTACARSGEAVYCWGNNNGGSVGNGTAGNWVNVPTRVSRLPPVVSLYVTSESTFCAVERDNTVWCWGVNPSKTGTGSPASYLYVPTKLTPE